MKRNTQSPKERLLITGTFLLLLLFAGVAVTGRIINRMAAQMSARIVTQIGEYHYHLLHNEFGKVGEALAIAGRYVCTHPECTDSELQVLTSTLMDSDPKLECIWFVAPSGGIRDFPATDRDVSANDTPALAAAALRNDTIWNDLLVRRDSQRIWCMARRFTDRSGAIRICGAELPLLGIHAYLSEQSPFSRSYATIFTPDGQIVYHPDSAMIGTRTTDSISLAMLGEVCATGREIITGGVSEYLGVEEERIYYPLNAQGIRWIAGIGIPRLAIEQQMSDFHFYTILTAVISILFFAVLLILAQRRWRREYQLRLESERESEQLHLQQVIEQIDPHFLFNSLNSLYALIRTDTAQAREFTLTLSRVYRHVLERRHEILATISDEIDFTWQYYSLQKIRFGERIVLHIAVDPRLHDCRIPSMSLQTLVENAVKHNSITAANPLRIRIFTDEDGLLIENNFTPRPDGNTHSLGTGLDRIRAVYRFYTEENIAIGTANGIFRCRLPLLPPEKTGD